MPYPNQPEDTPIPPKLDKWNWGAFLLSWIWGLGNNTFIALLMFVPFVNLIMIFVLGAKGSKWAWKNRLWADEAHFIRTQRNWARGGLVMLIFLPLLFGGMLYGIVSLMKGSEAYKMSMVALRADQKVLSAMGEPIEVGWIVLGNIHLNGTKGSANLSIPINGPKCSGNAISHSIKNVGAWDIQLLVVRLDCRSAPIILINKNNIRIPNSAIDT